LGIALLLFGGLLAPLGEHLGGICIFESSSIRRGLAESLVYALATFVRLRRWRLLDRDLQLSIGYWRELRKKRLMCRIWCKSYDLANF